MLQFSRWVNLYKVKHNVVSRSMATLRELKGRLTSVSNIGKIAKSMKMVATVKFARAERDAKEAEVLGKAAIAFFQKIEVKEKDIPVDKPARKVLLAVTSDRGLCGGVHTSVVKRVMQLIEAAPNKQNIMVFCIGNKARNIVQRYYPKNILFAAVNVGRQPVVFGDATKIVNAVLRSDYEADYNYIIHNRYISMVSFKTTVTPCYSVAAIQEAPKNDSYETSKETSIILSYLEFSMAARLYYSFKEANFVEQASRMTAMDNASRNASEMKTKIQTQYNHLRQSAITTELIEIIGASESMKSGTYQGQWLRGMRHGYGVRNSAPFGKASKYRNKALRASLTSLRSNEATGAVAAAGANSTDPAEKRDRRVDDSRGGFVLVVNSDEPQRRRSLGEKSIKRSLLMGLKLKKQKSTGDLEKGSGSMRSTGSSASWVSTDSAQSAITNASLHTDSNASFIVEDDQMDASVTETYMGEWKNDKRTGFGISERSDGLKYEGEWYANKKYGYGVTTFSNGEKEEGKYKNNVLITSNKKKHLFLMRSAKFRERIDAAVNAAQRASKIALQKADIAISRTATARGKAEQADIAAAHAREDSDIALAVAKQFAPDFKQPGLERFRARYNKDRYTDSAYSSQKDSSLSSSIANQFISEYAQNQVPNKIPNHVSPDIKVGNKMSPMGNQMSNQMTNTTTSEIKNLHHLQQQNAQNTTSNYMPNQSQPHNLALNQSQSVMPNQSYPNQTHNKSNQSNNLIPNQTPQTNFNSTMHDNKSIYGYELDNQISNVQKTQTRTTSVYSKPPPQKIDHSNQNVNPTTNEDTNRIRNSIPREEYSQANLRRNSRIVSGDRPYLGQTQQQSSIDYFDHYKRPPSRDSSVDRYTKAASRLSGSRQPSVEKTFIPSPETPDRTSRAPSTARGTPPVQAPAPSRNGAIMTGNPTKTINASSSRATTPTQTPFEEIIIRKRGLGQDIIPSPNQPKRTESLYNSNPAPTVKTIVEQTSLQRKKSLPDVQTLPKATEPMSREEVSYLGSMRREEVRRMNDEREKLRANPLLYLVSPQVKDWFSRQQLVIVVLFINISLAIMFFKILT